jgi:hypothetical protein
MNIEDEEIVFLFFLLFSHGSFVYSEKGEYVMD